MKNLSEFSTVSTHSYQENDNKNKIFSKLLFCCSLSLYSNHQVNIYDWSNYYVAYIHNQLILKLCNIFYILSHSYNDYVNF